MAAQVIAVDGVDLELFRRELTGYCYRMLGSGLEAEDAVQETMLRAWRAGDAFEGRSSVRSWLYRIATNVCIDLQRQPQRRARPMDLQPSSPPDEAHLGPLLPEATWITPIADHRVLPDHTDAAEVAELRASIRLAFVTVLQHLPPKQRAALILCDVLRWPAAEAAELLETSVASVNSALQRARATLDGQPAASLTGDLDPHDAAVVARYADAFERVFATPSGIDPVALAAGYGVDSRRIALAEVPAALAAAPDRLEVLVVGIDRSQRRNFEPYVLTDSEL